MALPLLLRGAKLTPDQKAQVQQIMTHHRVRFRDLFSKLRVSQDQMANKLFPLNDYRKPTSHPRFNRFLNFAISWPRKVLRSYCKFATF